MLKQIRAATVWFGLVAVGVGAIGSAVLPAEETGRKVTKKVLPEYPEVARKARIYATVKITAVVTAVGDVKSVRTTGGNPVFVPAAEQAVKQWKFEAGKGETTESISIKFDPS